MFEPKSSLSTTYKKYGILGIDHVIDLELCKQGYKLTNNILPVNLVASLNSDATGKSLTKTQRYNTRNKVELNLPKWHNTNYNKSFLFQSIKCYSELHSDLKASPTLKIFVSNLKKLYLNS